SCCCSARCVFQSWPCTIGWFVRAGTANRVVAAAMRGPPSLTAPREGRWTRGARARCCAWSTPRASRRPFLEQAPAPDEDGDILVIEVDGKGAPPISGQEHARRTRPRAAKARNRRHGRRAKRRANQRPRRPPGARGHAPTALAKSPFVDGMEWLTILPQKPYATLRDRRQLELTRCLEWLRETLALKPAATVSPLWFRLNRVGD